MFSAVGYILPCIVQEMYDFCKSLFLNPLILLFLSLLLHHFLISLLIAAFYEKKNNIIEENNNFIIENNNLLCLTADLFVVIEGFNWTCWVGGSESTLECMLEVRRDSLSVRKKNVWNNTLYHFLHSIGFSFVLFLFLFFVCFVLFFSQVWI